MPLDFFENKKRTQLPAASLGTRHVRHIVPVRNSRYEQACDQAIAMRDGNLRSTIKALIMANEYLETELEELQAAIAAGCVPARTSHAESDAA